MNKKAWTRRIRTICALAALPVLVLFFFEFVFIPWKNKLPRSSLLNGFAVAGPFLNGTRISPLGFSGDPVQGEKAPGGIRILILGGSNLFIRDFADRLRVRLEQQFLLPIEVVGAAGEGHFSATDSLKYDLLEGLHFDFVIVGSSFNDLRANHVAPADFRDDYSHFSAYHQRNWLLDNSLIARYVHLKYLYQIPARVPRGSGYRSLQVFRGNLRKLFGRIRANGATPILIGPAWHIPEGYTEKKFAEGHLGFNNPEKLIECGVEVWGPVDFVKEGIRQIKMIEETEAAAGQVHYLDLALKLNGKADNFGDVFHYSDLGTDVAAATISQFFRDRNLMRESEKFRTQAPRAIQ
jgi:hypothetical protein